MSRILPLVFSLLFGGAAAQNFIYYESGTEQPAECDYDEDGRLQECDPCPINNVVIPASVVFIGSDAFKECRGIRSLFIPATLTGIDNNALNDVTPNVVVYTEASSKPEMDNLPTCNAPGCIEVFAGAECAPAKTGLELLQDLQSC